MTAYKATERVCLNTDMTAVVPCDSPAAHFVLANPGQEISDADCEKYGISDKPAATTKAVAAPAENKAIVASAVNNKAKG